MKYQTHASYAILLLALTAGRCSPFDTAYRALLLACITKRGRRAAPLRIDPHYTAITAIVPLWSCPPSLYLVVLQLQCNEIRHCDLCTRGAQEGYNSASPTLDFRRTRTTRTNSDRRLWTGPFADTEKEQSCQPNVTPASR